MELAEVAQQLFFIIGCPRSGTTLFQSMLASHPDVILPAETGFYLLLYAEYYSQWGELSTPENFEKAIETSLNFYRIKDLNLDSNIIRAKCQNKSRSWETIFLAILATYAEKYHVPRIGEKSPRHYECLGILKERFPQAKFIHIIRDPRAVVLSLMKAPFGSDRIGNSCNIWQEAIDVHRQYADELGSERYRVVKYEDLVFQPEEILKQICSFLNLEFSSQMLQFDRRKVLGFNQRYSEHMSNTLKPIFTSSIDKWQNELNYSQIAIIQTVLAEEMQLLNYQPIDAYTVLPLVRYKIDVLAESLGHKVRKVNQVIRKVVDSKR